MEGTRLALANDSITMVSKTNGTTINSTSVPNCKALSVTRTGEIYYTGLAGTGKLFNMNPVWNIPTLSGVTIDANLSGAWVGKVIFESYDLNDTSQISFIDPGGNVIVIDTAYNCKILEIDLGSNNNPLTTCSLDKYSNDELVATALLKPYLLSINNAINYGSGFYMGKYNIQSIPKLGFSKSFWDVNDPWIGIGKDPKNVQEVYRLIFFIHCMMPILLPAILYL